MIFYVVIPAHNEENTIYLTLESLIAQTLQPKKIVVVDDNSSDKTAEIVTKFCKTYDWISLVKNRSSHEHLPGNKIVNAFYKGYDSLDNHYDIICKYDADLIFPKNYLETLASHYRSNQRIGMAAGHCYIEKNKRWIRESLTGKKHIRGALKSYRKACFNDIGNLKPAMGWDTIDELLALYHQWTFLTDDLLIVKHLKPTGDSYNTASKYLQGEAWYKLRFGFTLTLLASIKLAFKKRSVFYFINYLQGFFQAKFKNSGYLITPKQGKFIRQYRWKQIFKKLF